MVGQSDDVSWPGSQQKVNSSTLERGLAVVRGCFVESVEEPSVDVKCGLDRGVAEPVLNHPGMLASGDQQADMAMPQIVEPERRAH